MKKLIACLLCIMLLGVQVAYAADNVSVSEKVLPENGIHETLPEAMISPTWASGSQSTHQFIVEKALAILKKSYPSSFLDKYTATLKTYADWPDIYETDGLSPFQGHFYDPDSGRNYTGISNPTAKTRLVSWYNQAVSTYKTGTVAVSMQHLGRALHYVGDLSCPLHAANLTAMNSEHSAYENWVRNHQTSYIETSTSSSTYSWARRTSVSDMGHNFAVNAKPWASSVRYSGNETAYRNATSETLPKSQRNAVAIMFKFLVDVGAV